MADRRRVATTRTFAPDRQVDDAIMALVRFENGSIGTFEATRFGIGCKNPEPFQIHGSGGMLRFNLERLNHLEFVDATGPSTEQGPRDLLVTDLKHPIFGHFWRPGHIIGYEHTFIAALAEFLDCLARGVDFHPNFADGLAVKEVLRRGAAVGEDGAVDHGEPRMTTAAVTLHGPTAVNTKVTKTRRPRRHEGHEGRHDEDSPTALRAVERRARSRKQAAAGS